MKCFQRIFHHENTTAIASKHGQMALLNVLPSRLLVGARFCVRETGVRFDARMRTKNLQKIIDLLRIFLEVSTDGRLYRLTALQ